MAPKVLRHISCRPSGMAECFYPGWMVTKMRTRLMMTVMVMKGLNQFQTMIMFSIYKNLINVIA